MLTQNETTGTERKVSQLMGDGHFRLRHYESAIKHYLASGDHEKVIACADKCLEQGELEKGVAAYEAVGRIIPSELLIACGDQRSQNVSFAYGADLAVCAYKMAGASEKLLALAEKLLDLETMHGYWTFAVKAYIASGAVEKIRLVAHACLKQNHVELAFDAFAAIGDKEGLIAVGVLVQEEDSSLAIKSFEAAGSYQSLIQLGDKFLGAGYDEKARQAYEVAAKLYEQQLPKKA